MNETDAKEKERLLHNALIYMKIYDSLIERAIPRGLKKVKKDYSMEIHHIVPKCMGGTNDSDNLIDLYAEEHYIAHKLLALENQDNNKIVYAWWRMNQRRSINNGVIEVSPEDYAQARKLHSEAMSRRSITNETRRKFSECTECMEVKILVTAESTHKRKEKKCARTMSICLVRTIQCMDYVATNRHMLKAYIVLN